MQASDNVDTGDENARSRPDLGVRLRSAREAQGLTLDELAAELRITAHQLNALEECRFEALGPRVFAKGYLKQYGARLGLDVAALAADFDRTAGDTSVQIEPSRTIRLRNERQITTWILAGLMLVLLAAFLALWWLRQSGQISLPFLGAAVEPVPESVAGIADERPPASAAEALAAAGSPVRSEPSRDFGSEADRRVASPAAAQVPAAEPAAAGSADGPALEVVFVEDSWTEITAGDGTRLYYDLARAGTRARFPADPGLSLRFGNGGGVELSLDGRALTIPGSPRRGQVVRFDLGAVID